MCWPVFLLPLIAQGAMSWQGSKTWHVPFQLNSANIHGHSTVIPHATHKISSKTWTMLKPSQNPALRLLQTRELYQKHLSSSYFDRQNTHLSTPNTSVQSLSPEVPANLEAIVFEATETPNLYIVARRSFKSFGVRSAWSGIFLHLQ